MSEEWDDLVDPTRVALEALIAQGDKMSDYIEELEEKLEKAVMALTIIKENNPLVMTATWALEDIARMSRK